MPREDASKPEFWEKRFREGVTPWDAGRVPASLEQFLSTEKPGQRVLIPGCGSGYEVRAFDQSRFEYRHGEHAVAVVGVPGAEGGRPTLTLRLDAFAGWNGAEGHGPSVAMSNFISAMSFQGIKVKLASGS